MGVATRSNVVKLTVISLRVSSISNIEFGRLRSPQDILSRVYASNCRMWRKDALSIRLGQGGFIRIYRTDGGVGKSPSPRRKPGGQQRKAKGL